MRKKKILVVDDETELVQAVQIRLEQAKYKVLTAYDGEEGFQKAKKYKPDLIILDILMPHMGGDSMAAALKEKKTEGEEMAGDYTKIMHRSEPWLKKY